METLDQAEGLLIGSCRSRAEAFRGGDLAQVPEAGMGLCAGAFGGGHELGDGPRRFGTILPTVVTKLRAVLHALRLRSCPLGHELGLLAEPVELGLVHGVPGGVKEYPPRRTRGWVEICPKPAVCPHSERRCEA